MKKLLFTFLLAFVFTMGWSQEYATDKGAKFFGLSGSFSSQSGDLYGDGYTTLNINPSLNYLVAKNFFIGGSLEFMHQSQGGISASAIGIGPQLGVFFTNQESKVFPYLSTGIKYYSISGSGTSISGTNISLGVGMVIPVQKHIGITFDCSYHIQNLKTSGVSVSGNILTIGVGILGFIF
jgi:hypothetical protein